MREELNEIFKFMTEKTPSEILEDIDKFHPVDFLEMLSEMEDDPLQVLEKLPNDYIALLIDYAEDDEKYGILSLFSEKRKGKIIDEMSSDELVDLLGAIDEEQKEAIILNMADEDAQEVKELLGYDVDSAGGIMATEFIAIKETMTISETIDYLRTKAPDSETPYYIYVLDDHEMLKGVVALRDIIVSDPQTLISEIMNENTISIPLDMDQETVSNTFEKYGFMAMPVVDNEGIMRGIITADDVMEIIKDEYTEDMFRLAGLDETEKLSGSIPRAVKSRLPWLLVNLVTAILAAATVSLFEGTIVKIVALATFMPIVAGMGGNAGTQTLTLIIRGIALGELTLENHKEILIKEAVIGMIDGLLLGLIVAGLGYFWVQNVYFGLVIGVAMFLNLFVAAISGFFIPIMLRKIGIDPALASAVFVTTVTDVLGFFFFLGFATLMISFLV